MNIAIIGASGNVGSRIVAEAAHRGHEVTGIARKLEHLMHDSHVKASKGDLTHPEELIAALKGKDIVISSVKFQDGKASTLLSAAKQAGVKRVLVVGGVGNLEMETEAQASREWIADLENESDVSWTYMSPPKTFNPGDRTGKYRVSNDSPVTDAEGHNAISIEDYAVAMIDEIEKPQHERNRFTVGY